jgi:hypothetical protein
MKISKIILLIIIIVFMKSCKNDEIDYENITQKIEKVGVDNFYNIQFESRNKQEGKNVIYRFIVYDDSTKYILPNYDYFDRDKIMDSSFCDVKKVSMIYNKTKKTDYDFVKEMSNNKLVNYNKLDFYKIYNDKKNMGDLIVFYESECEFYIYNKEVEHIKSPFWKEKLKTSKKINSHWYYISCNDNL